MIFSIGDEIVPDLILISIKSGTIASSARDVVLKIGFCAPASPVKKDLTEIRE
jgi:hypothetical protein